MDSVRFAVLLDEEREQAGVETYESYADQDRSFTDGMRVAMVDRHDVDAALSFDDDFDGVVGRLDPATFE